MTASFPPSTPAGRGTVHLTSSPSQFRALTYAYPLKLISPDAEVHANRSIHTLFLLTYGGGLVAGDAIDLNITLDAKTFLVLLTQGSTKIFKTPDPQILSIQKATISINDGAGLVYLPDPVQPFAESSFEQSQMYYLNGPQANLCVCDWVCCGRAARGEMWEFWRYGSRNEIWDVSQGEDKKRLLLRDNLILDHKRGVIASASSIARRVDDHGVFGTLILRGPMFEGLGAFFLEEFEKMPRIGEKKWDGEDVPKDKVGSLEDKRRHRLKRGEGDGLLWTAANIRGFVMVKFAAREVEGAKHWLKAILHDEGSIESQFGERSLLCLK
ncbi:UreD-domain-containing protein [Microthyrium microscopicum]|uniref:UreD-domain-containing protein n=1 Tax=Microthyrium microscopicum TaxID=703497 RepID=A0A6A6UJY6_9PEZI|nr:UreD-domain-containing protein [Microthyrium microscopicum]